jgi:hypothetical protein
LALAGGCATTAPPPPVRLAVHVDRLAADGVHAFEAARLRFVGALAHAGVSDHTGLYLKIGDSTYYSIVSFGKWRDLDRLAAERKRALARVDPAALHAYWHDSDENLVFPHAGEIWTEQAALSYLPTGRRLGDAVELVLEEVAPTAEAAYEATWKQIARALGQARYPVERRTYFSSPGSGRMVSFWLAPSPAVATAAPTLQQALASVLGAARAAALLQRWHDCVLRAESFPVVAEPRLSSY